MKFTVEECLAQLPWPSNEKWKKGVWDVELFKQGNVKLVFFAPGVRITRPSTRKTNFISSFGVKEN